jgi:hypothetical protein
MITPYLSVKKWMGFLKNSSHPGLKRKIEFKHNVCFSGLKDLQV